MDTHEPQPTSAVPPEMTPEERQHETRLLRRMQMMMNMVMQTIAQDGSLTIDEASQMVADAARPRSPCSPARSLPSNSSGSLAFSASCATASASCNTPIKPTDRLPSSSRRLHRR